MDVLLSAREVGLDLLDDLRRALMEMLLLILGGAGLALLFGRAGLFRGGPGEQLSRQRELALRRMERHDALLPGTAPLHAVPRVRPGALDPEFSEPEMLVFAQRAFVELTRALREGRAPAVRCSPGALESLGALPRAGELVDVIAGRAWLVSTDRSPEWRTVDVGMLALIVEQGAEGPLPWREELVWRFRLKAELPLPSPARCRSLEEPDTHWELLAVLDQTRARLDLLPPRLVTWGALAAPPEPGAALEAQLAELRASLPPEEQDPGEIAGHLVARALLREGDEGLHECVLAARALEEASERLCGWTPRIEELQILSVLVTQVSARQGGVRLSAYVVAQARRWLEDAAGAVLAGSTGDPDRGALEVELVRSDERWTLWELRPARG